MRVKQFFCIFSAPTAEKQIHHVWIFGWISENMAWVSEDPPFDCGNISQTSLFLWKSALQWKLMLFPTKEVVRNIVFGQGAMIWGWTETLHQPPTLLLASSCRSSSSPVTFLPLPVVPRFPSELVSHIPLKGLFLPLPRGCRAWAHKGGIYP